MNNDYELAYKGIPKVTIVLRGLCFKCGRPVKTEGRIPEGGSLGFDLGVREMRVCADRDYSH